MADGDAGERSNGRRAPRRVAAAGAGSAGGGGCSSIVLVAVAVVTWAADTKLVNGTQVMRNTELVGQPIGGLGDNHLRGVVAEMARSTRRPRSRSSTGDGILETTLGELGIAVDQEATVQAALDAGRGSMLVRPFDWLHSFIDPHDAPLILRGDEAAVATSSRPSRATPGCRHRAHHRAHRARVRRRSGRGRRRPAGRHRAGRAPGRRPQRGAALLDRRRARGVAPRIPDSEAEALAEEANEITGEPLAVTHRVPERRDRAGDARPTGWCRRPTASS